MARQSTRQLVLDAAARILSQNQGASLAEVAEIAGVGRATVYRYFPTRDKLLQELSIQALDETDKAVEGYEELENSLDYLKLIAEALIPIGDKYFFLMTHRSSLTDPIVKRRYNRQLRQVEETVEMLKEDGHFSNEIPTAWIVACIDMLIYTAWQTVHDGSVARNEAADLLVRTLQTGFSTQAEAKPRTIGRRRALR